MISPEDKTVDGVRTKMQGLALAGLAALVALDRNVTTVLYGAFASAFFVVLDQVAFRGGLESLVLDSAARVPLLGGSYGRRVALHEAGHFLVAYLVGILPKAYTLSTWDAFQRFRTLAIQAGTTFCDAEFQREVSAGRLKASSLDRFCCVALAGVATEYLQYGAAEGGNNDVQQLDRLLMALGFSQKKASAQVRWALLNTVQLLRKYARVHERLADEMSRGASVGQCIALLEEELKGDEDLIVRPEGDPEGVEMEGGRAASS